MGVSVTCAKVYDEGALSELKADRDSPQGRFAILHHFNRQVFYPALVTGNAIRLLRFSPIFVVYLHFFDVPLLQDVCFLEFVT